MSAAVEVIVGLTSENIPKPSAPSVVGGNVSFPGGLLLPRPLAAFVGKTCTVPTPRMFHGSAVGPRSHGNDHPRAGEMAGAAHRGRAGRDEHAGPVHVVAF